VFISTTGGMEGKKATKRRGEKKLRSEGKVAFTCAGRGEWSEREGENLEKKKVRGSSPCRAKSRIFVTVATPRRGGGEKSGGVKRKERKKR